MPLAGSGPVLGAALATATAPGQVAALASWVGLANALTTWIVSNVAVLPGTLSAAGSTVSGKGALTVLGDEDEKVLDLAGKMATGAGARDGIEQWKGLAAALVEWIADEGEASGTGLAASPTGGPVTGAGKVAFASTAIGPTLAAAVGAKDAPALLLWQAVGAAILAHIASAAVFNPAPVGMTSPNGGGPVVGIGSIA